MKRIPVVLLFLLVLAVPLSAATITTGTISAVNMRLSAVDGRAFVEDGSNASWLSQYAGYRITITDSAGRNLVGYIKEAGDGDSPGVSDTEIVTNNSFTGTWSDNVPQDWTCSGTQNTVNYLAGDDANDRIRIVSGDGSGMGIYQTPCNRGVLYRMTTVTDAITGEINFGFGYGVKDAVHNVSAAGTKVSYQVAGAAFPVGQLQTVYLVRHFGYNCDAIVSDVSVREVLAPSRYGVWIVSAPGGSTKDWENEEDGFDRGDVNGYRYAISTADGSPATYYVDNTCQYNGDGLGQSCAAGTNQTGPKNSLANVVAKGGGYSAGDTIRLKKDTVYRERLTFTWSGTSGNAITLTNYGTGTSLPVINGGIVLSAWSGSGPVYTTTTTAIYCLFEDGIPLKYATGTALTDGNWFWASPNILYYRPTTGVPSDHVVDVDRAGDSRMYALSLGDAGSRYVTVDGLSFFGAYYGLYGTSQTGAITDITVRNCDIRYNTFGIALWGRSGTDLENIGVSGNTFANNGEGVFLGSWAEDDYSASVVNASIDNNRLYDTGWWIRGEQWWDDLPLVSSDMESIGLQNAKGVTVSENVINDGSANGGIVMWYSPSYTGAVMNRVNRNYVYNAYGAGIIHGAGDSVQSARISNNVVVGCGKAANPKGDISFGGIRLNSPQSGSLVANNTLLGNDISIYIHNSCNNYDMANNISYDPRRYHVYSFEDIRLNTLRYNDYYPDGSLFRDATHAATDLAGWRGYVLQDTLSFIADPLFGNSAGDDYRPRPASPALGAGTDLSAAIGTTGYDGLPMANTDGSWPIGAWGIMYKKKVF